LLRDFTFAMRQDIPVKIMFADYVAGDKANKVSGHAGSGRAKTIAG
jgi:hypothetical protein